MTEDDLLINTKLGRYRITGRLGRGGMGVVYSGEDVRLQRAVAIKVLSASPDRSHEALQRFLLEARAAARLNHPNVVAVHDIGQHDGRAYIVMELVPGGSAQARLRLQGACPGARPRGSSLASAAVSRPPTRPVSSIATSSPATSSWTRTVWPSWPTSAWPRRPPWYRRG